VAHLRQVLAACCASPVIFVYRNLHNCTHISLHQDGTNWALVPPYSGLYKVLSWRQKTLQLLMCSKPVTVLTDRIKLAYIMNEDCRNTTFNPAANAMPFIALPATLLPPPATRTTHFGCHVRFATCFNT
jgi:hypothetical protein